MSLITTAIGILCLFALVQFISNYCLDILSSVIREQFLVVMQHQRVHSFPLTFPICSSIVFLNDTYVIILLLWNLNGPFYKYIKKKWILTITCKFLMRWLAETHGQLDLLDLLVLTPSSLACRWNNFLWSFYLFFHFVMVKNKSKSVFYGSVL